MTNPESQVTDQYRLFSGFAVVWFPRDQNDVRRTRRGFLGRRWTVAVDDLLDLLPFSDVCSVLSMPVGFWNLKNSVSDLIWFLYEIHFKHKIWMKNNGQNDVKWNVKMDRQGWPQNNPNVPSERRSGNLTATLYSFVRSWIRWPFVPRMFPWYFGDTSTSIVTWASWMNRYKDFTLDESQN